MLVPQEAERPTKNGASVTAKTPPVTHEIPHLTHGGSMPCVSDASYLSLACYRRRPTVGDDAPSLEDWGEVTNTSSMLLSPRSW